MTELLIALAIISVLILHIGIREVLATSVDLYESDNITDTKSIYRRWTDVIVRQKGKFGLGTTGPYLLLIILVIIGNCILFNLSYDIKWLLFLGLFASGYMFFSTCISITYSYKHKKPKLAISDE